MKVNVKETALEHIQDEIIAVGVFEKAKMLKGAAKKIDMLTGRIITEVYGFGDFPGKLYQTQMLYATEGVQTKRVLLVGLGEEKEFSLEKLRGVGATAARFVRDKGIKSFVVPVSFVQTRGISVREKIGALLEGILLGLYRFSEFKSSQKEAGEKRPDTVTILVSDADELRNVRSEVHRTEAIAHASILARDLVSRPGNSATPNFLAQAAKKIARQHGLSCKVLDKKATAQMGMGSYLGVARGSDEPARFIIMEYKPAVRRKVPTVVLIGKGITFDSGGISLKPPNNMEEMKTDMAGGAAVLGTMQAVAAIKLPVHVVGLVPATENLPSGHALKPGDIVRALSGKTIEIISTDAEGRLVLADALSYAPRYKPDAIIDLATLTGACIIALGNHASGIMGNNEKLIEKLRRAGDRTGERVWPLPLWEEYGKQIKSDIADIKNVGGREAGTITAGYFLKEFVGDTPWVHLDIAGTAWTKKDCPYIPKGATGVGVRLLVELLSNWSDVKRETKEVKRKT